MKLFNGWTPDVIFSWEFPSSLFRELFPESLILDIMPGAYMRPPYPKTISIDPVGLYKNSFLKNIKKNDDFSILNDGDDFYKIQELFSNYFVDVLDAKKVVLDIVDPLRKFNKYWLVPLQISRYFGFYANSNYNSQFEFLLDVLKKAPKDVGIIATQYTGGFIAEKCLSNRNIGYIRSIYKNFLYTPELDKLDNISQYIAPWADAVVTVSSTLGLQSLFFGNKLYSHSTSHLSYLSNEKCFDKKMLASLFVRQNIIFEKLTSDSNYFSNLLYGLKNRASDSALDVLNSFPKPVDLYKNYLLLSPFSASDNQMNKMGGNVSVKRNSIRGFLNSINNYDYVSFDVFDTLVRRVLYKPEDVFLLMQEKLENGKFANFIPIDIARRFAQLRTCFERQVRKETDFKRDSLISENIKFPKDEFLIEDVYKKLLESCDLDVRYVKDLVEFEQSIELMVLEARSLGKYLFDYAISLNKKIIIVSDFIHEKEFVEKVLKKCGYKGYEELFVSSEVGLKKHSGDLFDFVIKKININPERIIHIGDNTLGDFKKTREKNINSCKIFSTRERVNNILKNKGIDSNVLDGSLYLRTAVNLCAEEYYDALLVQDDKNLLSIKDSKEFFGSGREFGFLAIGPIMYEFTKWILDSAIKNKCEKVLFFARDCYLSYEISKILINTLEKYKKLEVVYLAVSRKALTGLNIRKPDDCFKVRLNDFSKQKTLENLLQSRFKIKIDRVENEIFQKWGVLNKDVLIKDLALGGVYGIVFDYLKKDWDYWSENILQERKSFEKYLKDLNIESLDDVIAVDFGYKGSAHYVVREFFEKKFIPAFFMTYCSDLGRDPYPDANVFFHKNMNVKFKSSTPIISHNLILETIINEPVGSLCQYSEVDGEINLLREVLDSETHKAKIQSIHFGVLDFSRKWVEKIEPLNSQIKLEENSAIYLLNYFLTKPNKNDGELLRGVIFDNAFSGAENKYLISPNGDESDIWKEGSSVLMKKPRKSDVDNKISYSNVGKITGEEKIINFLIKDDKKKRKYYSDRKSFFKDSNFLGKTYWSLVGKKI